ncbi:prephenate dehydrogenase [Flaviflexus ciconiae]|uniref:Prephenate dehydrogenase n=1 Tax=Flaviflexus ciconiae TaxID=2496867 RepID=A0A3Q9G6Z7_9ACTO|nr:prephenate dehydrogenase [Flaviflexus ciconiae]AZQ76598.1 prephenate dehydrogenase [Flaviflexus ciconiae]
MIIRIVGSGLLGTSLGLALSKDHEIQLVDASPIMAALAEDLGAGKQASEESTAPDLVIVATPPDVAADMVNDALSSFPQAIVTDVASVKNIVVAEVEGGKERYVGSHPMAGRERSGAIAADGDLFIGRPWVVVPHETTIPSAVALIKQIAMEVGAFPVEMTAEAHDAAVARVSHVPQLMSSLLAATLTEATPTSLDLAGQGLRDVTRIASSDAKLWSTIIAGNPGPVSTILKDIRTRLDGLIDGVDRMVTEDSYAGVSEVAKVVSDGNVGVSRIPGKHGGAPMRYATVTVLVPDKPGELGRLFTETGEIGANIEDLTLEHSRAQPVGRAAIAVNPSQARPLADGLEERGWTVASVEMEEN